MTDFDRDVKFYPAFHRCNDPEGNYGIGGIRIVFALKADRRAVSWTLLSNMGLPEDRFIADGNGCTHYMHQGGHPYGLGPSAGGVSWCSPVPLYDWQKDEPPDTSDCLYTGGDCWGDTGFILGNRAYEALAAGGDEALWNFLAQMYEKFHEEAVA